MLSAQPAKKAIQSLPRARRFSSTPAPAAVSPYKRSTQSQTQQSTRRNVSASSKQSAQAQAATAPQRAVPSPAFNRDDQNRMRDVQPLQPFKQPEMDHSFVGMKGGEIFHEMMLRQGVKHVFGYPGGAILPVFDAIYNSKNFEFILPRHEQGAGHMAEGYARATGKPGVVLVTSGPGATNTITPMQDALMDGTPLVVFSGQVVTSALGSDAFQEADIVGISR
ncbi:Acetolactate synthase catalytic subunit, partial [Hortaea werneckii]